ncbi:MAG: carbamoyltransferase HypF, partial [Oscillospiraceae bacterium]
GVLNYGGTVLIYANVDEQTLSCFIEDIKSNCPFGGRVDSISHIEIPFQDFCGFDVIESEKGDVNCPQIPIDFPLCEKCKNELYDKNDPRYLYHFISCASCGPRYSIIRELPYDRTTTAMDKFPMCDYCETQYNTRTRRRQAQTISCHACGPQLLLKLKDRTLEKHEAFEKGVDILKNDGILAIKNVGGYQFVCSPYSEKALSRLRKQKARDAKPFAVIFNNSDEIEKLCCATKAETELVNSISRPIVLFKKSENYNFCELVCGDSLYLGAFLPSSPLQDLLINRLGPLICTSANISSEPIIYKDEAMLCVDTELFEGVLYNTREIITPLDDSVARVLADKPQLIRRAKGFVPEPIRLKSHYSVDDVLCTGGDLKASFGLVKNDKVYLSQYFGDLENADIFARYKENFLRMCNLFHIKPKIVVSDLHPSYYSSRFALSLGLKTLKVQHHHAHIASVMAENDITDSVIGFSFDGTGFGDDGCVWGSEVLICKGASYKRVSHLEYTKMCGGDKVSKDAELSAMCYINSLNAESHFDNSKYAVIKSALQQNVNTHLTSSFGRLFDAVAYLTDIKRYNSYEGECAIALENFADYAIVNNIKPLELKFDIINIGDSYLFSFNNLLKNIISAYKNNASKYSVALGFHRAVVNLVVETSILLRNRYNINKIALSGGVFQNRILTTECLEKLSEDGFDTYINRTVPTNDGGIALGQAFVACEYFKKD